MTPPRTSFGIRPGTRPRAAEGIGTSSLLGLITPSLAGAPTGAFSAAASRREVKLDRRATQRLALFCACGLALAALVPPLGFIAFPSALGMIGSLPAAYGLVGLLLALPALLGIDAARLGLHRVVYRLRGRADKEHVVALSRVFAGTVLFAYAVGLVQFGSVDPGIANIGWCLALAGAALVAAWAMLLYVMMRPAGSALRRSVGLVFDATLFSGFLHFGDAGAAAAYPFYLLVICEAGFHLGGAALATAAALNLVGFAGVVATTPYWQQQPLLSVGLASALIIVAALLGLLLRLIEFFKHQAAAAAFARNQWVQALNRVVRRPEFAPASRINRGAAEVTAPAFLSEINDILDLSAIEAGEFATRTETFDLHLLVNRVMAQLRPEAAAKGLRVALRIDPRLPFQLRGARVPLSRVLRSLAIHAIESASTGAVRIAIDADRIEARRARLLISIRFEALPVDIGSAAARFTADPFGETDSGAETQSRAGVSLALASRLAELIGGEVITDPAMGSTARRLTAVLPMAIEESGAEIGLDLGGRPVLIVTEDSHFAHDLAEPLTAWQADARWIGGFDAALAYLPRLEIAERPILLVDGRNQVLSALSFVNRAAPSCTTPPFMLFIADEMQVDGLAALADDEFDALVPAPVDDDLLGNALHALPLQGDRPPAIRRMMPEISPATPVPEPQPVAHLVRSEHGDGRVTPITAHPRFAAETADVLDPAAIEALRGLDAGEDFLREVIGSFRVEAHQILDRLKRAAASGDIAAFGRAAQALRSAAAIVGGTRVCEMLTTLRRISPEELRERGAAELNHLATELSWLDAALASLFGPAEVHQR